MTTHRRTYEKQAEGDAVVEPAKEAVAKQQTEEEIPVEGSKPLPVEETKPSRPLRAAAVHGAFPTCFVWCLSRFGLPRSPSDRRHQRIIVKLTPLSATPTIPARMTFDIVAGTSDWFL
jgi:hypothetical protein